MDEFDRHDDEKMNRRDFLAWAAAAAALLALPGCQPPPDQAYNQPRRPRSNYAYAQTPPPEPEEPHYVYVQQPQYQAPAAPARTASRGGNVKVSANSRNSWGAGPANPAKMKAMNGVTRVTVHHEGSAKPNTDSTDAAVAATLRLIQQQHRQRMGAGDIGYHFIIDRNGTIWQGRDWKYQGAHTSGANSNNIGVMLLGNFEIQQPTPRQVDSLSRLTASLLRKYGLSRNDIYGHSDFCNTKCPGRSLKPYVVAMRKSLQA